jgi:integral membrane protein
MHWFTDKEAWAVFRFFAYVQGIGWTILILALTYGVLGLPQTESVVSFGRSSLGIFFGLYFIMSFIVARSLGWGVGRVSLAIISGVPPYGSILFERLMTAHRKRRPSHVAPPAGLED